MTVTDGEGHMALMTDEEISEPAYVEAGFCKFRFDGLRPRVRASWAGPEGDHEREAMSVTLTAERKC